MTYIFESLEDREKEINEILSLIEFLNDKDKIYNGRESLDVTNLLRTTAKGSVYLLLYSLVESTLRDSIVSIHDKITETETRYENLRKELKEEIWRRAKRDKVSVRLLVNGNENEVSLKLHQTTLINDDLFSGNIDKKEVDKMSRIYGFSSSTDYHNTNSGDGLAKVKKNRNDLAHGNKTFSMVGGDTSIEELRAFSNQVICYMSEISDNINDYVDDESFIKS
jgi:hypothetical protein